MVKGSVPPPPPHGSVRVTIRGNGMNFEQDVYKEEQVELVVKALHLAMSKKKYQATPPY